MKQLLITGVALAALIGTPALAADMPLKAPYSPPPAAYSWTGCYIGANGGGGRAASDWGVLLGLINMPTVHSSGSFGGGQIGCDYQAGQWVLGVEGQFDWSNLRGQAILQPQGAPGQAVTKLDRFATATGRIGYAFDRVLPYLKGGVAWAHFNNEFDVAAGTGTSFAPFVIGTENVVGFVIGAGIEVAFLPHWSAKVEYNYLDFGTNGAQLSCATPGVCGATPSPFPEDIRHNVHTVMFGLNYRFSQGWGGTY